MSDRRAAAFQAYGQLSSEVSYLINKTRSLPVGEATRRLLNRLAAEAARIDADLWDDEQTDYPQGERRAS